MNLRVLKNIWTLVIVLFSFYFIFYKIPNNYKKNYKNFYKSEINGKIDSIYYGEKSQIIVRIKDKEINLYIFNISKGEDINKGDSLFKRKKSKNLELHSITSSGKYIFTQEFKMNDY